MSLYKQAGSENWYIDLRNRGRRVRRTTGTTDHEAAKQQHDELAAKLWKIKTHGKHLSDALLAWTKVKTRKGSAFRTLKQIRANYPDRPLSEVTEDSILDVFGNKSPGTYNKIAAIFRAALNIAHAKGWSDSAPKIARKPEPTIEPRYLTIREWSRLRAELPEHLVPMAEFALATGLRWANVAGLTWDRVSLKRQQVWIPATAAKAGKTIQIPLSDAALAALRATGRVRKGPVFLYKGAPIGSPKTAWNKACVRAGLGVLTVTVVDGKRHANYDGFHWHDLRHTWASWHTMRGTPLDVLQKLGAWQTRAMVERYAHLAPSYVAKFAGNSRLGGVNFGGRKSA